jgi:hypothetical protein
LELGRRRSWGFERGIVDLGRRVKIRSTNSAPASEMLNKRTHDVLCLIIWYWSGREFKILIWCKISLWLQNLTLNARSYSVNRILSKSLSTPLIYPKSHISA